MLKHLQTHNEFLDTQLKLLELVPQEALDEYDDIIQMFRHLDFDPAHEVLSVLYSHPGRLALAQIEILRAYILADFLNVSWEVILQKLKRRAVYRAIFGIEVDCLPTLPSFYELSRRLMPTGEVSKIWYKHKSTPKKKLKKMTSYQKKANRTAKLAKRIRKGNFALHRPELFLQQIFKYVSIESSIKAGLMPTNLTIRGDDTCIRTGASSYGRKICACRQSGFFNCDCPRPYSDPLATIGWDSREETYFYGYTAYFLATYHCICGPLRPAVTKFRQLYPALTPNAFLSNSASDNYETYHLLNEWQIPAIIALNKRVLG